MGDKVTGIVGMVRPNSWKPQEINILKSHYSLSSRDTLKELLPSRKWEVIINKAEEIGLKRKLIANFSKKIFYLNDFERGYIAGMIDGEGSIIQYLNHEKGILFTEITITNTNLKSLKFIKKTLNCGEIYVDKKKNIRWKKCWKYRLFRQGELIGLLELLEPYLIIKKSKARKVIKNTYHWLNSYKFHSHRQP